jgi:hypothetical protein
MKSLFCLLLSISVACTGSGQAKKQMMEVTIKAQAAHWVRALMAKDSNTYIVFMDPRIIALARGKDQLKQDMDSAIASMKRDGRSIKEIQIGSPGQIILFQNELQCILPQTTIVSTPMGTFEAETTLIAMSMDKGQNWYFIDTNVYKEDRLRAILPDLSPSLVIPPEKQPRFTPNKN